MLEFPSRGGAWESDKKDRQTDRRARWGCETALMTLRTAGSFCEVMTENNKKERWGWQWRWRWPQVGNATRSAEGRERPRLVKGGRETTRKEVSRRTTSGDLCMIGTGPIRPQDDVSVPSWASGGVFPSMGTRVVDEDGSPLSV